MAWLNWQFAAGRQTVALSNIKDAVQQRVVKGFIATLLIALGVSQATTVSAQNAATQPMAYPMRSVRLFVPFPAGTVPDILIRAVTQPLSQTWGRPIVVENRAALNAIEFVNSHTLIIDSAGSNFLIWGGGYFMNA